MNIAAIHALSSAAVRQPILYGPSFWEWALSILLTAALPGGIGVIWAYFQIRNHAARTEERLRERINQHMDQFLDEELPEAIDEVITNRNKRVMRDNKRTALPRPDTSPARATRANFKRGDR